MVHLHQLAFLGWAVGFPLWEKNFGMNAIPTRARWTLLSSNQ